MGGGLTHGTGSERGEGPAPGRPNRGRPDRPTGRRRWVERSAAHRSGAPTIRSYLPSAEPLPLPLLPLVIRSRRCRDNSCYRGTRTSPQLRLLRRRATILIFRGSTARNQQTSRGGGLALRIYPVSAGRRRHLLDRAPLRRFAQLALRLLGLSRAPTAKRLAVAPPTAPRCWEGQGSDRRWRQAAPASPERSAGSALSASAAPPPRPPRALLPAGTPAPSRRRTANRREMYTRLLRSRLLAG